MINQNLILSIIAIMILIFTVAAVVSIICYFLKAVALLTIANKRGIKNGWLSFIPVCNNFMLGAISEDVKNKNGKKSKISVWLVTFSALSFLLGIISLSLSMSPVEAFIETGNFTGVMWLSPAVSLIAGPLSLITMILSYVAGYSIFKEYSKFSTLFTVISIFFPFMFPIFLFVIRKSDKVNAVA